jgi:hypothetical protein
MASSPTPSTAKASPAHALRLMNFAWMGYDDILRGQLWLPPAER